MLGVTAASVVGLAMVCFTISMAHIFYRSKRKMWQIVLCWSMCLLTMVTLGELLRPSMGNRSGQFSGFLGVFAALYLFQINKQQGFFIYFFITTSMYITTLVSRYTVLLFYGWFPVFNPRAAFVIAYFLLTAGYILLFFCWLKKPILRRVELFEGHLGSLTAFACIGYVLMLLLFDVWAIRDSMPLGEYLVMLLYLALLSCGYYISFFTMGAVRDTAMVQVQVEELTAQARQSEQYYVSLADRIQEVRRMQHDSRHHLRVLSGYVRDGAYGCMEAYLSTLIEQSPGMGDFFYCANYTANILLGFYAEQARSDGIEFQCDAQIPAELDCTPVDVCTVLGNALQNALDACTLQKSEERRYISLLARMVGRNLTLEIKNSYDGIAVEKDGHLLTRKGGVGHGLGLSSIQRVAELYHGYCNLSHTGREFTLRVVLTLG